MYKFLRVGGVPVLAAALWIGGGTSAAFAQQGMTTQPSSSETPVGVPAVPAIDDKLQTAAVPPAVPLLRGNILTLPLRPAPVPATPTVVPLSALVMTHAAGPALDAEATCLATAVYFESKGESLEGQLAVAQVVLNRAGSGRYPATLCAVVKQRAQFSFVRLGQFPRIDARCAAWRKAQAIARIAAGKLAQIISTDVLWYHADYVAPSWGRRLARVHKIGAHIFYRA